MEIGDRYRYAFELTKMAFRKTYNYTPVTHRISLTDRNLGHFMQKNQFQVTKMFFPTDFVDRFPFICLSS